MLLEVCLNADCLQQLSRDVVAACDGGAVRIELCSAMAQQGLTPTYKAIELARCKMPSQQLMVMIRPREGDFCYSGNEFSTMLDSIEQASVLGADGVVLGVLSSQGELALTQLSELVSCAKAHRLSVTFHRGFDVLRNPIHCWHQLGEFGVDRILTSGTSWHSNGNAITGIQQLRLYTLLSTSVELVVAGGVCRRNAQAILAQLTPTNNALSLHTHSGVLTNGRVDSEKVSHLAGICNRFQL